MIHQPSYLYTRCPEKFVVRLLFIWAEQLVNSFDRSNLHIRINLIRIKNTLNGCHRVDNWYVLKKFLPIKLVLGIRHLLGGKFQFSLQSLQSTHRLVFIHQQENDYHNTPYYSRLKEKCLRITNIIWLYGYTYVYFLAAVEAIIYTLVFFLVTKKKKKNYNSADEVRYYCLIRSRPFHKFRRASRFHQLHISFDTSALY
jgi:hypothetical protein